MPATVLEPKLLLFGDTYGKYGGKNITDTEITSEVNTHEALDNRLTDQVEFSEFEKIIRDYILGMLGHPVVRVELSDFQLKIAIGEAISKFSYHAPLWTKQLATFEATAGYNAYKLPQYIADSLTYVVYKKTLLSIQQAAGTLEFDFFIKYFQDNFVFADFNVGDYYLLQQHMETVRKVLGQEGDWELVNNNILMLYPTPVLPDRVIVEYRAMDTQTINPAYKNWMQRYATAVSKGILGEIRGKYTTLPSPGGGATLNGPQLIEASMREKEALMQELLLEIEEPAPFSTY